MYTIQQNIPTELIIEVKGRFYLGLLLLVAGIIGELLTIYVYYYIILESSFTESSVFLNILGSGALPFSFFINLAGGICLVVSFKELFFRNGWILCNNKELTNPTISKYKKFLSFSSSKIIKIELVVSWIMHSIYIDELKYYSRERILIEYKDTQSDTFIKDNIIEFVDENSKRKALDLLNEFEKIIGIKIPIQKIESGMNPPVSN